MSNSKLVKKLEELENLDITKALLYSGLIVQDQAKQNIVANGSVDTGELLGSIRTTVEGETAYIFTPKEYAPYVECGTGLFAAAGDGRKDVPWRYQDAKGQWHSTVGQHPKPFLQPALRESEQEIQKTFAEEVRKEIDRIVRS